MLYIIMPNDQNQLVYIFDDEFFEERFKLELTIKNLPCNPSLSTSLCVLSEMLSWVSDGGGGGGGGRYETLDLSLNNGRGWGQN